MSDDAQSRITQILLSLSDAQRKQLLDFAEYLLQKHGSEPVPDTPLDIKRPDEETVVDAIKRLTVTYPMLDTEHLLHEVGELMTQHVMQSRSAAAVIDDLEALFGRSHKKGK